MKRFAAILLIILSFASQSLAQGRKPVTISELVTYSGKDREQVLYAGAKDEGNHVVHLARGRLVQSYGAGVREQVPRR